MEALSVLGDDEWRTRSGAFANWCHKSMTEKEGMTDAVATNLEESVTEPVGHLVQYAIEPAH
ncbi:hypothetical protein QBC46DRAFT_341057 [Diplogelasinospora grovesii]|uniref:Uncharacterized protein n=1 Tax=Diplogelasinospora grovesii TaxID=303347 RepID=A0AAN6S5R2_9PEZI|nr:hypothetical protein QBC46DRAFT_341057 [Diplogelasinospora grovesii]